MFSDSRVAHIRLKLVAISYSETLAFFKRCGRMTASNNFLFSAEIIAQKPANCLKICHFSKLKKNLSPTVREITLRKLYFHFLSHWMGYDRGDSFPFDFEPKGNPFGSKLIGKLSPRSYPIQCKRNWEYSILSACLWLAGALSSQSTCYKKRI